MATYIIKLNDKYLLYSTVVDAPITYGLELDELIEELKERGAFEQTLFDERMKRVEEKGTSCIHDNSVEDTTRFNRAGPNETNLTLEELIEQYVNSPQ